MALLFAVVLLLISCDDASPAPTGVSASATTLLNDTSSTATEITASSVDAPEEDLLQAKLLRVIDGDTIEARLEDGSVESVRYIGIDTPETVHPEKPIEYLGEEATEHNRMLVEGKDLRLELDVQERDRYGRVLAYVWANGTFVNLALVRDGFAYVSTFPPNMKHAKELVAAQQKARGEERGLWAPREQ